MGAIPEGVDQPHNLQLIRKYVQREYGAPATYITHEGQRLLAVGAAPKKKDYQTAFEAPILQDLRIPLHLLPGQTSLSLNNPTEDDQRIITDFLDFNLRSALYSDEKRLWKGSSPYIFYIKDPKTLGYGTNRVDLYPGFSCRTQFLPNIGFGLVIDTQSMFLDAQSLAEHNANKENWRRWIKRHFLYEFGDHWYFIQLKNIEKKSIQEAQFADAATGSTTNLFDYLTRKFKGRKPEFGALKPDDLAITYGSANQQGERYAASSLVRLRYQTSEPQAQAFHKKTILTPDVRLQELQSIIETYLSQKIRLEGITLDIAKEAASVPYRFFPIPSQRFGKDKILPRPQTHLQGIREYWSKRKNWLDDSNIGIYLGNDEISSHYLMLPVSITDDEDTAEKIEHDIKEKVQSYSPVPYNPKLVVWDDKKARSIPQIRTEISQRKELMIKAGVSCAVVVLPQGRSKADIGKLRRHIKKVFSPEVRVKCVQASELIRFMHGVQNDKDKGARRYQSYLENTALDILVTSGYRLWVLNEPLHYDLYIGIDVLNNIAGFTFVAGGGAICRFTSSQSEQKEQLSAEQVSEVLGKHLREIIPRFKQLYGRLPQHLVIHRDGRWFSTESQGFNAITTKLYQEGLLPEKMVKGVVEIQKTSAQRWRLFAREKKHGTNESSIYNPIVGSYFKFTAKQGLICTTGAPGRIPGTSKPLVANIVEGNLDIEKVLRDIYWLSVLAWTKPDGVQSLPITIKLADTWLEPIGAAISENEAMFEDLDDKDIGLK